MGDGGLKDCFVGQKHPKRDSANNIPTCSNEFLCTASSDTKSSLGVALELNFLPANPLSLMQVAFQSRRELSVHTYQQTMQVISYHSGNHSKQR